MQEKMYKITVDNWATPGWCSGISFLFGTEQDIDAVMAAYRDWRLAHLQMEKETAEWLLVSVWLGRQLALEEFRRNLEGTQTLGERFPMGKDLPACMRPVAFSFHEGEDGRADTTEADRRLLSASDLLARPTLELLDDEGTYDGAWRRFKNGDSHAEVFAAYQAQPFATEIDVIAEKTLVIGCAEREVRNIWGWPSWLKWDNATLNIAWLALPGDSQADSIRFRAVKYRFSGFAIRHAESDPYSAPSGLHGLPGLLVKEDGPAMTKLLRRGDGNRVVREYISCSLNSRLFIPDLQFSSFSEMRADIASAPARILSSIDFEPLFLALVGDG